MQITNQDWEDTYKPIPNPLCNVDTKAFETYGEELEFVMSKDVHHVWTEIDGDNGCYIVNGYALVNRIQYYVTERPWVDGEDVSITICEYEDCECTNNQENDPEEDCENCGGTGQLTRWEN
jgi:hypothetical protein